MAYEDYYESKLDLEVVPPLKKYKYGTFNHIIQEDREERQAIIDRNNAKIQEARLHDRKLNTSMIIMDRIEGMVDGLIDAIDRYSTIQACKHPITININAPDCDSDAVRLAVKEVLEGCNTALDEESSRVRLLFDGPDEK